MRALTYPHDRVDGVLVEAKLPLSCRIMPRRHLETPLGITPADSRFCAKTDGYTVLYVTPDFATAFVETVVRDRFAGKAPREVLLQEVTERAWAHIQTTSRATLRLLDLRKDGCVRLGAPTDAVNARNHAAGRALGRAVYAEHKAVHGFLFSSRLTGGDAYALFDRALSEHPALPDLLSQYDIRLITT